MLETGKKYNLVGKIVKEGQIVGYRLREKLSGVEFNVARNTALANIGCIENVKRKGDYLVFNQGSTRILPLLSFNTVCKTNEFRDFSDCEYVTSRKHENGLIECVVRDTKANVMYVLKMADKNRTYKGYLAEFICSRILNALGYCSENVILGYYKGRECAAIRYVKESFVSFSTLRFKSNADLDSSKCYRYDVETVNSAYKMLNLNVDEIKYDFWLWTVIAIDLFFNNTMRTENKLGFESWDNVLYLTKIGYFDNALFANKVCKVVDWTDNEIIQDIMSGSKYALQIGKRKCNAGDWLSLYKDYLAIPMREFLTKYELNIIRVDEVLKTVVRYNKRYARYVEFIKLMFDVKVNVFLNELAETETEAQYA